MARRNQYWFPEHQGRELSEALSDFVLLHRSTKLISEQQQWVEDKSAYVTGGLPYVKFKSTVESRGL